MGGITVVLSGDFRQTLPIIPKGMKADKIQACLKSSPLWQQIKTMNLLKNMRSHLFGDQQSGQFAQNLLMLGEGRVLFVDNDSNVKPSPISIVLSQLRNL